jgi:type IV fimbrial biogenesis protein FimT
MRTKKGFTLIEVLIVISLIGILVTIASISGKAWLDNSRVEGQMKAMFTDLTNARISAMVKNRTYFVVFSPSAAAATQYTIYQDTTPAPDGDGVLQTATDAVVTRTNLNAAYSVTSDAGEIDFDSRGLVSAGLAGTETTIRVIGSFGSAYDCIVISATKTRMGVMNDGNCAAQ